MNRIQVVQRALKTRPGTYLEVGVSHGAAFKHIAAREKLAVDPVFRLTERTRRAADNGGITHYFETTSDDFFAQQHTFLQQRGVDVALLDGLHTYQQALRDVENTLRYLREDGVIVMHDCNPASSFVGQPAIDYDDFRARNRVRSLLLLNLPAWTGDVWKSIVHLRSSRRDLEIAVLDCDRGVGVVRKGTPDAVLDYTAEQIAEMDYQYLAADRSRLLNLQPPEYLDEFLGVSA